MANCLRAAVLWKFYCVCFFSGIICENDLRLLHYRQKGRKQILDYFIDLTVSSLIVLILGYLDYGLFYSPDYRLLYKTAKYCRSSGPQLHFNNPYSINLSIDYSIVLTVVFLIVLILGYPEYGLFYRPDYRLLYSPYFRLLYRTVRSCRRCEPQLQTIQ